jgi:putative membrane protein
MALLIRWGITALALLVTVWLLPGIRIEGTNAWVAIIVVAAVLGLVNAFIRPILRFLSCGLIVATLGLFTLVINAATLALSSWIAVNWLNIGFYIDGFWPAFWGAILISIVSFLLSLFVDDTLGQRRPAQYA